MKAIQMTRALLCIVFLSSLLISCGDRAKDRGPGSRIEASLRLAWVFDMAEVGVFVAKEQGFYEKEGIDLDIQAGGFGLDSFKLVAAGSNDFGVGGAGNLLLAREKGMPLVAIAAEFQNTPVGFIVREDSGIKSFPDFRGKKVGIQTGADTDVLYRALLKTFGMASSDVKEVPIQYDMMPFVSGQIDVLPGYVTNQPITLAGQGIDTHVITASSQGLSYYGNVFFTTEATLKEHPDLVARFTKATKAGWDHALSNKADAISALKAYTKDFSDADLDRVYDAVMPFIKPDQPGLSVLGMSRERWESTYDVLKRAGLSTAPKPIDGAFIQQ